MAKFYDIELVDVNPEVNNFSYDRVPKEDYNKILNVFKEDLCFLDFKCATDNIEQNVFLERKYFRGVMAIAHILRKKTIHQENSESAKEVSKITLQKRKGPTSGLTDVD